MLYVSTAGNRLLDRHCVHVTGVLIILALVLPAGFWWFALGGALIAAGVWLLRC